MIRTLLLMLSCTYLLGISSYAQTTNAFRVNYDQALLDLTGNAVEALIPSNYVIAGTNVTFIPIYGTITQIDGAGNLVWSKRYSDASFGFQLNDIKRDDALGEYYLCGGSDSDGAMFMRVDATGNVIVSKKFSINEADGAYFNRVIKTSDGGYVAVGYVTGHDPDGAGPEVYFASQTCTDGDGNTDTEYFGSPLIVKLNSNGDHVWHKVFRYYDNAAKNAVDRIYNDASFVDVVEVSDGYMAVGSYDVRDYSPNADCDDTSPTDAIILKTTTAGAITYHRQFDNHDFSSGQNSKYFGAINKTSAGAPIAVGYDNGREWITKYPSSGGWGLTFSRLFTYSSSFLGTDPVDNSQIYEVSGSTDLVTMGMYIRFAGFPPLPDFRNALHRVNSTATTNVWTKTYTFGMLGAFLPRGSQVSDGGYIMSSMTAGVSWDYHVIKTDPSGDTPLASCAPATITPSASAGPTTIADPYYNVWSGTVGPQGLSVIVQSITPTQSVQCSYITCTAPTITTQPTDNTLCSTDSDVLSVVASSGPYQWQYNNGGTWENVTNGSPAGFSYANGTTDVLTINTSGAAQGTYQFQVLAGTPGCEATSNTLTVTVPGANQLAPTGSVCSGTALNFEALPSSGATYAWMVTAPGGTSASPASGIGQTFTFTPTNTTGSDQTFDVNVDITYNGTTCPSNFSTTVFSVPSTPVVGTIAQPTCSVPTGSVDLSGLPSGSWTVIVSPGGANQTGSGTTATISGLAGGNTYTFTVENAAGCVSSSSTGAILNIAPSSPSTPIVGTIIQPTCSTSTGSVDLSGLPSGNWTITANPGAITQTGSGNTATFTGLNPNTYTFTITNDLGCTSLATVNVTIDPQPVTPTAPIVGTITQPDCSTATGSVDVSGLPTTGNWTLTVSPGGATQTGSGTSSSISGLTANGTYTVTVTNDAGCTSASSSNILVDPQPAIPSAPTLGTATQPTCTVSTGSVDLNGLPSSGNWTITVSPGGATQTGTGATATVGGLAPGSYTFTVTNDQGCTSAASSSQTIDPVPTGPNAPTGTVTQPTCSVPTGTIEVTAPIGANFTYSIDGTNYQASTTISGLTPGTYTITVLDNATGCSATSVSNYTIDPVAGAPVITLNTQTNVNCANGSDGALDLTISGGVAPYTIAWTPNVGTSEDINNLSAGSYTILVTDNLGCSSTNTYTITQPNAISGNGTVTDIDCSNATSGGVSLTASGGSGNYTYSWTPNNEITPSISNVQPGNYSVTITDDSGCAVTENYSVGTTGSLNVDATPEYSVITSGESVDLTVTGATDFTWTPSTDLSCSDCSDPTATPSTTTSYIVTGTDALGCSGSDTVLIVVEIDCAELFVPTIFSPNGSGPAANETLCVFGECLETIQFRVFNRWGELVFETESAYSSSLGNKNEVCWDGNFRGKPVQEGVFVYTLYAKKTNGDVIETSGNITVVR